MDVISTILSVLLFVAFVPGVLVKLPPRSSDAVVLVTHALLFSITLSFVMKMYWSREHMGNYGVTCPNGYAMGMDQVCRPVGHPTYDPSTGTKAKTE